jgi:quercetin dioxygenase-like cupin family protein
MKIISLDKVNKTEMKMEGAYKVQKQLPLSAADGAPAFSFRVFTVEPQGHTPYHTHPFEHLNYIIEGNGVLVTETGEEFDVKKGDFAMVLPDEKHQYRNKSESKPLIFICAVPKEYE